MAATLAWPQQQNNAMNHHPRSLGSMLAGPGRASAEVPQRELEGESKLIALGEDFAPLFEVTPPVSSARTAAGNRDNSSRELLTDLFPTGFTSSALSPPLAAASTVVAAGTAVGRELFNPLLTSLAGKVPELKAAAVASSTRTTDGLGVEGEGEPHFSPEGARPLHLHPSRGSSQQLIGYYEVQHHQPSCGVSDTDMRETGERNPATDEPASETAAANTSTGQQGVVGSAAYGVTTKNDIAPSDRGDQARATDAVAVREREDDELKRTLHRLIPRLLQSEEKVKFLEGSLEQAKHAESGRNALVKQITTLEEEVRHSQHRLEIRRAEALQWREQRKSLEADIERLSAELHGALGRNTRLETESRRKDVLLAEARKNADERAQYNSKFEAELRHKDQLLMEAERDKKRAWQTTNASAETAKTAMMRAEAAVKEATDLRNLRSDGAGGKDTKRSSQSVEFSAQERQTNNRTGRGPPAFETRSLSEVVAAESAAAVNGGSAGPNAARHGWGPTESSLVENLSVRQLGDGYQARSLSAERGGLLHHLDARSMDTTDYRARDELGQCTAAPSADKHLSVRAPRVGPQQTIVVATDFSTPRAVPFDGPREGSEPCWWKDRGMLSPWTKEAQEVPPNSNPLTPGSRRRVAGMSPPAARATRREQCHDGDRQRHDSEGVKGALTGASPAWTGAPSKFGDGSSGTAAARCGSAGSARSPVQRAGAAGAGAGEPGKMYGLSEQAYGGKEERRDHTNVVSEIVGSDAGLLIEEDVTFSADALSPVSRGWEQQDSPCTYPAAGHRKGRDLMSARRSSLSGAGVGVAEVVAGEAHDMSPTGPGSTSGTRRPDSNAGNNASDIDQGDTLSGRPTNGNDAYGFGGPPSTAEFVPVAAKNRSPADDSRLAVPDWRAASKPNGVRSPGRVSPERTSAGSAQLTVSLASLLDSREPADASDKEDKGPPKRTTSAPFATDAVEDELRPIREVERRLMLLQMETSQLESEQSRLVPKASKMMQARVQLKKIETRLALLANESSGLRRVLREKPWRM